MDTISAKAQIIVHATPEAVFDAFYDARKMSKFWFTRRDEGLHEGKTVFWYIGDSEDTNTIEVRILKIKEPELIRIEWQFREQVSQVQWSMHATGDGNSKLTIEETGFNGTESEIVAKALDSTGGFNQVIIALKAFLEHGAIINVVEDHP